MSDLSFIDKLDQEQLQNLNKIIDRAEAIGVDPRLAVTLAYTESQLRQMKQEGKTPSVLRGSAGEIGIMQIKPSTAKLMGFDEKQIMDRDANIDAGLQYLKQNLDRYKDPVLGAMAYNTGPDHPFFQGKGEPSEQGLNYVNRIQSLGGFIPSPAKEEQAAPSTSEQKSVEVSEDDFRKAQAAMLGSLGGAGVGAIWQGKGPSATMPSGAAGASGVTGAPGGGSPGEKWSTKVTGYVRPGADTVTEAAQAYQRAKGQGPVTSQISKKFGPPAPSQPGVFTGGRLAGMAPPTPPQTTGQAIKSGLQSVGNVMQRSPVVTGALAGAGAGYSAQDASERYQKGDKLGAGIAAAGALGSAASMIPTLPTRVIGGGMAMASPAALAVLDKMRKATPEQTQRMLTNVDPMGNPLP